MKIFILFSITILLYPVAYATDTLQYSLHHYTDENGLPQNSIKAIAPARSGFIWLATENGLVRFDGQSFRVFDKNNIGITSSRITWLVPDPAHKDLFAVTEKNQVIHISGGNASLYSNQPYPGHVNRVSESARYDHYYASGLPNPYQTFTQFNSYRLQLNENSYFSINHDRVSLFRNEQKVLETVNKGLDCWKFFLFNDHLYNINGSHISMLDGNKLVEKGRLKGDILSNPAANDSKWQPVLHWNVLSSNLLVVLHRSLYLVKALPDGSLTTQLLLPDFDFKGNNIMSIYYDEAHQRLFMGSQTRGLYVLTRKQFHVLRSAHKDDDEVFYAQFPFGKDRILTSTGDVMGLNTPPTLLMPLAERVKEDRSSVLIDQYGSIWTKQRNQLYKFNPEGSKLLWQYDFSKEISQLYETKDGKILIGTKYGNLYQLTQTGREPVIIPIFDGVKDVTFITQETADLLWIGTGKGAFRASFATGRIDTIGGLREKYIRSIMVREPGEVWITTYEDGFFLFRNEELVRLPTDKDGYLNATHCILEDNKGYFWITTNKGLFQAARKDLLHFAINPTHPVYYLYYDRQAGFNTNEFNGGCQPCGLKLPNGYFSFPSINGLVWGHPDRVRIEVPDHDLYFDDLEIDGKRLPSSDTMSLKDHFDLLKLQVTTPYFGHPYNVRLDYALVRNNEEPVWQRIDGNRTITLSAISSGNYQLLVRKLNGFGEESISIKSIAITIPLAFYETWWFRVLSGLLIIAGLWLYTRFRFEYIKRKNKLLEVRIDERTQALQNTLNDLRLSEESLRRQTRLQDRLITAITHDIKSPLKYMTMAARRMFDSAEIEPDYREIQRNARMLYESGYRMYHLTDNLLQYIKLNSRDNLIAFERVDVEGIVDDKIEIFRDIAAEQTTTLHNEMVSPLYMRSNNRLLGVVIHNLLDNAIKVTFDGHVKVTSGITDEEVIIRIEDTGVGMSPEMVAWCNSSSEPDDSNPNETKFPGHAGFGLIIVKELVSLMKGRLRVSSEKEIGTKVELIFDREMLISR